MKIKHRNNIIKLVGIHLMLLIYPMISKTVHVHQEEGIHQELSDTVSFEQCEEFCPVCDFEFYNFVPTTTIASFVFLKSTPVYNSPEPEVHFVQVLKYFSLRAPPVA